ncbi:MAG: hypothetical protein C0624_06030 [Desulfuromonas sp.]|nr:MAG: hypothetical protein C0624_06030 [Desulfuromonas sp.]
MADVKRLSEWPLPAGTFVHMLLRSFCLQASWNFERLQNLGFLFVLLPGLKKLYQGDELAEACSRHLEYFNSHPYLAPTILGASLRLECDMKRGHGEGGNIEDFKKMVMAPYAAMGDAFFWGGIRPLAAVVALFFAFQGSFLALPVFLLLFNLPHLVFRIMGLRRGLKLGLGVIHVVQAHRLPDLAMKAKEATVVLFGGLAAVLSLKVLGLQEIAGCWGLGVLPLVLVVVYGLRRRVAPLVLIYLSSAVLLLLGMFVQ